MKVTKKRLMSGLSILCALMILIGVMPSGVFASTTETYNNNCIYFNISNIIGSGHNESEWNNGPVYVYKSSWNNFTQMTRVSGTNVYKLDVSGWSNRDQSGSLIFTTKNSWDEIKASDYRRTSQDSSVNVQTAMGKEFSWNGSGVTKIDNKNTFDMTKSSVSVGSVIGGGESPTQPPTQAPTSAPTQPPAPSGSKNIYFDATLSKLEYKDLGYSIPSQSGTMRYYATGGGSDIEGNMSVVSGTNNNIYKVTLPSGYKNIAFSAFDMSGPYNYGGHGESTQLLSIPSNLTNPCFFADTSDNVIYGDSENHQRDGYWGEYGTVRDAEAGKKTDVVDIQSSSFTSDKNSNALYLNSTFYDYYTDYELNGKNRDTYNYNNGASQRNWVPFRQFDQALSDLYKSNNVSYPVYTGHFQPDYSDWGTRFSEIAYTLNLYGHNDYNKFFSVNNSTLDSNGNGVKYDFALQGLVSDNLNGNRIMTSAGNVDLPHFNPSFINGNNSKKTKLGEVYNNVAFPFTKRAVFGDGVEYWWFDSAVTTLMMRKDDSNSDYDYYLKQMSTNYNNSKNVDSSSSTSKDPLSNIYGFFPFNETSSETHANTYNYGFGTKIEFEFEFDKDTTIDAQNAKFLFSGDDDVWVYIDGKLILDVGGDHGQVTGLIDFSNSTSYLSKIKAGGNQGSEYSSGNVRSINYDNSLKTENIKFSKANEFTLDNKTTHKLTFYYMERGMWESNMKIAFNFPTIKIPSDNQLEISKSIDTSNVNTIFANSFDNTSFNFKIDNLATHYGSATASAGVNKSEEELADYCSAKTGTLQPINGAIYKTTKDTSSHTVSNGTVTLGKNETVTFDNQFRTGSYISINEQFSSEAMNNLFTTNWNLYEDGSVVASKENSRGFDDGRREPIISLDEQTGNNYNGNKPDANTMVFRSYSGNDSATKLNASCKNEVNVGSLSVKKTGDSALNGQDFNFAIKFSNVGGIRASASTDTINFTLKCNDTTTTKDVTDNNGNVVGKIENGTFIMTGIPVGTQYTIYETKRTGVSLTSVNGSSSGFSFDSSTGKYAVTGTITAKGTAYNYNFGNEKDVVNVEITKTWNGETYNANKHSNVPNSVDVVLEKSENNGSNWTEVNGYNTITLSKNNGFKYSVKNLEKYTNKGVEIQYRVKELDSSGSVINGSGYCNYNDKYYQVTYPSSTTENGVIKLSVDNTSYGFKIQKFGVPSDTTTVDWSSADKLKGAKFKVTATISGTTYKYEVETNDDGIAELNGIVLGTYTVEEIEAPEGYKLNEHKYTVTINTRGFSVSNTDALSSADYSNKIIKIADNEKVVIILPGTGGEGTNIFNFALFGVIAVIISGGMWLLLNKKIKSGKAM